MAYTKTPTSDTYSEEDIDISREIDSRGGQFHGRDEDYYNVVIEKVHSKSASDDRTFVMKREGTQLILAGYTTGMIRGSIFWEDQQKLYYAVGKDIRVFNLNTDTGTTISNVFSTTTGDVGFAEYIYDNGTVVLVASDGTNLVTISTSNVVTTCVDPDLPSPHEPHIVFLDGYIFLIKSSTGDIYNSVANDPMSWDPADFINAEIEADWLRRLIKVNNYLVGLGTETMEYLWDAAVATGSPMQRNDTPVKKIGFKSGLATYQNTTFFIGNSGNGPVAVYKVYDFKADIISTPTISRYLGSLGGDFTDWIGNIVSFNGHVFYVITAGTRTWAYDLDMDLWVKLAYQGNVDFNLLVAHNITANDGEPSCIFSLNDSSTAWNAFSPAIYQDSGVDFSCIVVTDSTDFGTLNRKTMSQLSIFGDRPPIDADILIQWTDDDYQTFDTGLSTNLNQDLPCVRQLGSFRQRAFKLTFAQNTIFRIQKLRAKINKGNT